jgi:alpha-glucuronidase
MAMSAEGEDGYELWLRYRPVDDPARLARYRQAVSAVAVLGKDATAEAIRSELIRALPALLGRAVILTEQEPAGSGVVAGTADELESLGVAVPQALRDELGEEGFVIRAHESGRGAWIAISGNTQTAVLRGTFHFLRLLQTHQEIQGLDISSRPRIRHRVLAHWDNLDGSIERGYAGRSLWKWGELPERIDP